MTVNAWCCPNPWDCHNHVQHTAPYGCVHWSNYVPDRHDTTEGNDQ